MQDRHFDIAGPNPTPEELKRIDQEHTSNPLSPAPCCHRRGTRGQEAPADRGRRAERGNGRKDHHGLDPRDTARLDRRAARHPLPHIRPYAVHAKPHQCQTRLSCTWTDFSDGLRGLFADAAENPAACEDLINTPLAIGFAAGAIQISTKLRNQFAVQDLSLAEANPLPMKTLAATTARSAPPPSPWRCSRRRRLLPRILRCSPAWPGCCRKRYLARWRCSPMLEAGSGSSAAPPTRSAYNGNGLQQTLGCASDSYKFELSSDVRNVGGRIEGTWSEATRGVNGSVEGRAQGGLFEVVGQVAGLHRQAQPDHPRQQPDRPRILFCKAPSFPASPSRWRGS